MSDQLDLFSKPKSEVLTFPISARRKLIADTAKAMSVFGEDAQATLLDNARERLFIEFSKSGLNCAAASGLVDEFSRLVMEELERMQIKEFLFGGEA